MKNSNKPVDAAQGADTQSLPVPTIVQVTKWLTDDVGRIRKLIETLHNNPAILRLVAEQLHGEIENYENAKKSQAQNDDLNKK